MFSVTSWSSEVQEVSFSSVTTNSKGAKYDHNNVKCLSSVIRMQGVNAFSLSAAIDPYNALSTKQSESEGSVIPQWMNYKEDAAQSSKDEDTSLSTSTSTSSGIGQLFLVALIPVKVEILCWRFSFWFSFTPVSLCEFDRICVSVFSQCY